MEQVVWLALWQKRKSVYCAYKIDIENVNSCLIHEVPDVPVFQD